MRRRDAERHDPWIPACRRVKVAVLAAVSRPVDNATDAGVEDPIHSAVYLTEAVRSAVRWEVESEIGSAVRAEAMKSESKAHPPRPRASRKQGV